MQKGGFWVNCQTLTRWPGSLPYPISSQNISYNPESV